MAMKKHTSSDLNEAIGCGDVDRIRTTLQSLLNNNADSPRFDNLVLRACKANRLDSLKYLLSKEAVTIITKINGQFYRPEDVDNCGHNIFYHCLRWSNPSPLHYLVSHWPGAYFTNHQYELHRLLSSSYQSLLLKNVPLSHDVKLYTESKLLELNFSHSVTDNEIYNLNNIKVYLELLVDTVSNILTSDVVDEKFLYLLTNTARNINLLKVILKHSLSFIPWCEIELCITCFLFYYKYDEDVNLFYRYILNVKRLKQHLTAFLPLILNLNENMIDIDLKNVDNYPLIDRDEIVRSIVSNNPDLKHLYEDHSVLKNVYTLSKIKKCVSVGLSVDAASREGRLVLFRTLMIISENIKDSLVTPYLDSILVDLILLSFPSGTRKLILDLRNAHLYSTSKRINLKQDQFVEIKNHLKTIESVVSDVLLRKKLELVRIVVEECSKIKYGERLKEINKTLMCLKDDESMSEMVEDVCVAKYLMTLRLAMGKEDSHIKPVFEAFRAIINGAVGSKENHNVSQDLLLLISYAKALEIQGNDNNFLVSLNNHSKNLMDRYSCSWNKLQYSNVCMLMISLFDILAPRVMDDSHSYIIKICCQIFSVLEFDRHQKKNIEQWMQQFSGRNEFVSSTVSSVNIDIVKVSNHLKDILSSYGIKLELNQSLKSHLGDNKLLYSIQVLLIDIMTIMKSSKMLVNNTLCLTDSPVILTGENLLNILMRNNYIVDVFLHPEDIALSVILNAISYVKETIENPSKQDMKWENKINSKSFYERDMRWLVEKCKLFKALECGQVEKVLLMIKRGAEVLSRDNYLGSCYHYAARAPSVEITKYLLECKVKVDVKDDSGQTPLHVAAEYGRTDTVSLLLKQGLSVNEFDNKFKTPLHLASLLGHYSTVKTLVENGANINMKDSNGKSSLHYAVENNHLNAAKYLFEKQEFENTLSIGNFTPLHIACDEGHLDLVNYFISSCINVNTKADNGSTPLHCAATKGYAEIVEVLIEHGADVHAKTVNGLTPMHTSAEAGHTKVVELLWKQGAKINVFQPMLNITPLFSASEFGHSETVKFLMNHGADANKPSKGKYNPLLIAVQANHKDVVDVLVKYKVDVNAKYEDNISSLHFAAKNGSLDIVEVLIKHKACVNARTKSTGLTPLHFAAEIGHCGIVNILIQNGATVNSKSNEGTTALHCAAKGNAVEVIALLLKNNAKVLITDRSDNTALHVAVANGCKESAALLLQHMSNVNLNTSNSPLFTACLFGQTPIVELLINHGLNVNVKGKSGHLLLMSAIQSGQKKIVELLLAKGASVKSTEDNMNMISLAVINNRKDILEVLLKSGVSAGRRSANCLCEAIMVGSKDIVEVFLNHNVSPNAEIYLSENISKESRQIFGPRKSTPCSDNSLLESMLKHYLGIDSDYDLSSDSEDDDDMPIRPLMVAACKGKKDIVDLLLSRGANVNVSYDMYGTPLHSAASFGYTEIVQSLLKYGAKVNAKDGKNCIPFQMALSKNHLPVVDVFLSRKDIKVNMVGNDGWRPLHIAAQGGSVEMASRLIERGADIKAKNNSGLKPIHIASKDGHTNLVEYYISLGLSVDEPGSMDFTPLHCAAITGHLDVMKFLISKKADVNAGGTCHTPPIHAAAAHGQIEAVKILLQAGAFYDGLKESPQKPINNTTSNEIYKLLDATEKLFRGVKQKKFSEVVSSIKAGAYIDAKDSDSGTVLHFAAWKGYDKIVKVLLENKCNPNIGGKSGFSPLHYAAKFSHYKVVALLLLNGAIYNILSDNNKTPLDLSKDKKTSEILTLIDKFFAKVQSGDEKLINDINKIKDEEKVKIILKAQDRDRQSLLAAAVKFDYPFQEKLKEIFQGDVKSKLDLAQVFLLQERFDEALDIYATILNTRKEFLAPSDPNITDLEINIASVHYSRHDYDKAMQLYQSVFKTLKDNLGQDHKDTLKVKGSIALVLHRQGKHREALDMFQQVLDKQKTLGENHPDVVETMAHKAIVLIHTGKFEEALQINYQLFNDRKKEKGLEDVISLVYYNNIAMSLNGLGRYEEAIKIYQKVYNARVKVLGPSHSQTLRTLQNMASAYMSSRKFADAFKLFNDVLKSQKASLGSHSRDVFLTTSNIANALLMQRNMIGALKFFQEALTLGTKILGANHVEVISIKHKLDVIKQSLNFFGYSNVDNLIKKVREDMMSAANTGDTATVLDLINSGANINDRDSEGRSPLHFACNSSNIKMVKVLLENGADVTLATDKGNTVLHTAVSKNNFNLVQILVNHINDTRLYSFVNFKTKSGGTTALHLATKNNRCDIVMLLLSSGAVYNVLNSEKQSPLCLTKNQDIKTLLTTIDGLFNTIKTPTKDLINKLKQLDTNTLVCAVKCRNLQGKTLSQFAIENNNTNLANEILDVCKKSASQSSELTF